MEKILFICNSSQSVFNYRLHLIKSLKENGYDVEVVTFDNEFEKSLSDAGINIKNINIQNRSVSLFNGITLKKALYKCMIEIKPDIVFNFMAKPNIFGSLAAKKAGIINIYCMVEGAGEPFSNPGLKWRLIKFIQCRLYKKAFKHVKKVFFLNHDDKKEFVERGLLREEQGIVISGIGVDLNKFYFTEIQDDSCSFILMSRLLKTKGIFDYCKVAEIVKNKYPQATFYLLGRKGDIDEADIKPYIDKGNIEYYSNIIDVRPYLEKSLFFVFPSYYREGFPMSIMESESMGRGIIAYDNVGTRDSFKDGFSGFLVEKGNYQKIADICEEVLANKQIAIEYGKNARKYAEEFLDKDIINNSIISVLKDNIQ